MPRPSNVAFTPSGAWCSACQGAASRQAAGAHDVAFVDGQAVGLPAGEQR
jgi:hypothetical protein